MYLTEVAFQIRKLAKALFAFVTVEAFLGAGGRRGGGQRGAMVHVHVLRAEGSHKKGRRQG